MPNRQQRRAMEAENRMSKTQANEAVHQLKLALMGAQAQMNQIAQAKARAELTLMGVLQAVNPEGRIEFPYSTFEALDEREALGYHVEKDEENDMYTVFIVDQENTPEVEAEVVDAEEEE